MPPLFEFFAATAAEPRALALVVVVIAAAAYDWRTRRVPNVLSAAGAVLGVALATAGAGTGPSFAGSIGGGVLGLAMLLPLYALRTMGAGDVKLMAAVGAFVGLPHIAFAVLFTFMAGGLFALVSAAWQRALPRLAHTLRATVIASLTGATPTAVPSIGRMPYALAICAGTFACLWLRQPFHA